MTRRPVFFGVSVDGAAGVETVRAALFLASISALSGDVAYCTYASFKPSEPFFSICSSRMDFFLFFCSALYSSIIDMGVSSLLTQRFPDICLNGILGNVNTAAPQNSLYLRF